MQLDIRTQDTREYSTQVLETPWRRIEQSNQANPLHVDWVWHVVY